MECGLPVGETNGCLLGWQDGVVVGNIYGCLDGIDDGKHIGVFDGEELGCKLG